MILKRTRTVSTSGHFRMRIYRDDVRKAGASVLHLVFNHVHREWKIPAKEWFRVKDSGMYSYEEIVEHFGKYEQPKRSDA